MSGPAIARALDLPRSTVCAVLRRLGLGKLTALEPRPPAERYEPRPAPPKRTWVQPLIRSEPWLASRSRTACSRTLC